MQSEGAALLSRFAENLPGAAFYYNVDAEGLESIEFLNSSCEEIWEVKAEELEGHPGKLWANIHPDDLEGVKQSVAASGQMLSHWEQRFRLLCKDGSIKHLLGRGTPEMLANGGTGWLTFLFDVSAQMRTQQLFETVTQQLEIVSAAIPDGFALFNPQEKLVVCNAKFREAYGFAPEERLKGQKYKDIVEGTKVEPFVDDNGLDTSFAATKALQEFRKATGSFDVPWGQEKWIRVLDRPTSDGGRVSFRIDITEAKKQQRELERVAYTDTLTGLSNRRGLATVVEELGTSLPADAMVAVCHIDLDKFKSINDALGHEAGDYVLQQTADQLTRATCENARVFRVGGDEFVVVMSTTKTECAVVQHMEELRKKLTKPMLFEGRVCQVGASIGIAFWTQDSSETLDQGLLDADTALIAGKSMGRAQTVVFRPEMRQQAVETAKMAAEIKTGLIEGAFVPFFQPQIHYPSGEVTGLEMLARWKTRDGQILPAQSFISIANETGLIKHIDEKLLGDGLTVLAKLQGLGLTSPRLSFNLSSTELYDETVAERLMDELFVRGISTNQVNIEILESTLLDDRSDTVAQNIYALANAGFRIELDDFGTGHTALASLTKFPVHQIKVDRSLVRNIDGEVATRSITEGIFQLCEKLGIQAIAEGVETQAELNVLVDIGFSLFQGFFFAEPMSEDQLLEWMTGQSKISRRSG